MYGAILGDIIGSPYEFDKGEKTKDFPLFRRRSTIVFFPTPDAPTRIKAGEAFISWGSAFPCRPYRDEALREY